MESKQHNKQFPTNEDELAKICKEFDIPKRKAYLNFNEDQFLKNILLMDLSLVHNEINDKVIMEINDTILSQSENTNINIINNALDELGIRTFLPQNLLDIVAKNKIYIHRDDNTDFRTIQDTNVRKTKLLF